MHVQAYRVPGHDASQVGADGVEAILLNLAVLVHDEVGCVTLQGRDSMFKKSLVACAQGLSDRAALCTRSRAGEQKHHAAVLRKTRHPAGQDRETPTSLTELPRTILEICVTKLCTGAIAHAVTL